MINSEIFFPPLSPSSFFPLPHTSCFFFPFLSHHAWETIGEKKMRRKEKSEKSFFFLMFKLLYALFYSRQEEVAKKEEYCWKKNSFLSICGCAWEKAPFVSTHTHTHIQMHVKILLFFSSSLPQLYFILQFFPLKEIPFFFFIEKQLTFWWEPKHTSLV